MKLKSLLRKFNNRRELRRWIVTNSGGILRRSPCLPVFSQDTTWARRSTRSWACRSTSSRIAEWWRWLAERSGRRVSRCWLGAMSLHLSKMKDYLVIARRISWRWGRSARCWGAMAEAWLAKPSRRSCKLIRITIPRLQCRVRRVKRSKKYRTATTSRSCLWTSRISSRSSTGFSLSTRRVHCFKASCRAPPPSLLQGRQQVANERVQRLRCEHLKTFQSHQTSGQRHQAVIQ